MGAVTIILPVAGIELVLVFSYPCPMTTALPDVLPAADLPADTEQTEVVVIGFGIAGGCAALEAARSGAKVVLLERAATYGGTSAMSGGHFYLGGGTAVQ